ncbi:hypothetical protein McanCB49686_002183 [Microsporum canis]
MAATLEDLGLDILKCLNTNSLRTFRWPLGVVVQQRRGIGSRTSVFGDKESEAAP